MRDADVDTRFADHWDASWAIADSGCWAVLAPTAGPPPGALAGEYIGATGEVGMGLGAGVNVLIGGSGRSFALQPVSVEGSVALNVTLGLSHLQLRAAR